MKYLYFLLFPLLLACNDNKLSAEKIKTLRELDSLGNVATKSREDFEAFKKHQEWELEMSRLIVAAQNKPDYKEAYRIIDSTEDAIYATNPPSWFIKHQQRRHWRDSVARAQGLIK